MRVGLGYDSHCFAEGRQLVLGGVSIDYPRGLDGWSDADAATHALIDALCGAASLGDIGTLFPAGDIRYQDACSLKLLEQTAHEVKNRGLVIGNVDITVVVQEPVLAPHVPRMRAALAAALGVDEERVSVKAKTNEHMGFVGRGEGIAAIAVALLE